MKGGSTLDGTGHIWASKYMPSCVLYSTLS